MGDRANIYLHMPAEAGGKGGVYLYTHWAGYEWPEELRQALVFGRERWDDDQYLPRIITTRVFRDLVDSTTGGGLSVRIGDNEYPIICVDVANQQVGFAAEGAESQRSQWYDVVSFEEYVAQDKADYK